MAFLIALSIVILIVNSVLGIFIYLGNRKNPVNQLYFLNAIALTCWILSVLLMYQTARIFFFKMAFVASSFIALFFLHFCRIFPRKSVFISKILDWISFAVAVSMACASLITRFVVSDIGISSKGEIWYKFGPLYPYWAAIFLASFAVGLLILINKYRQSKGIEKLQIKYFFIGVILSALVAITTNLLFPLFNVPIEAWQYGPLALVFLTVFTTYSITRHHLMNLKLVATELLVGLVSVVLLIDLLLSERFSVILFKLLILLAFFYLGVSLIQSVLQEIKRRKEMEALSGKLQKAYKELKKIDVAKTEFISIASHQLRTPLTVIKGYVSMMLEGSYGKLPKKAVRPLKNVLLSNERLIRLVNDLLTVSKVEMGKLEVSFQKAKIEEIIEGLVEELDIKAKEKGLYLKWQKPKKIIPTILIDKDKIRQAIFNIIDNGIKYTEKGGITIKLKVQKSKIKIIITDTGAGLTKAEASKLFYSFSRGSAGARLWVEGVGLGLFIAKKFIDYHKGKIWAESKGENRGSTFYIELPIK